MALKNFSFRESWVGREVAGMKIAFLTKHGSLERHVISLPSMWLKDWLTKVKTYKIVTFC